MTKSFHVYITPYKKNNNKGVRFCKIIVVGPRATIRQQACDTQVWSNLQVFDSNTIIFRRLTCSVASSGPSRMIGFVSSSIDPGTLAPAAAWPIKASMQTDPAIRHSVAKAMRCIAVSSPSDRCAQLCGRVCRCTAWLVECSPPLLQQL